MAVRASFKPASTASAKTWEIRVRVIDNVKEVIVGKDGLVTLGVVAMFTRGHVLIGGVPGIGKTMFARSMAKSIGVSFKRIPCTADLLPSDVTGVYVFDQPDREFVFRSGPVLSNIVMVDEVNRSSRVLPSPQALFPGS